MRNVAEQDQPIVMCKTANKLNSDKYHDGTELNFLLSAFMKTFHSCEHSVSCYCNVNNYIRKGIDLNRTESDPYKVPVPFL